MKLKVTLSSGAWVEFELSQPQLQTIQDIANQISRFPPGTFIVISNRVAIARDHRDHIVLIEAVNN